jgi:UDP-glucose 4-epimerase
VTALRVVVTGAAGGLGSVVSQRLIASGVDVIGVDLAGPPLWASDLKWYRGQRGDISDMNAVLDIISSNEPEAIVNLAGVLGTEELWRAVPDAINANLLGAFSCLAAARLYDAHYIGIETGTFWNTPYSITKRAARELAQGFRDKFETRTTVLRVMNVYGPFHSLSSKVVPRFFRAALSGQPLPVNGSGSQMLDLVWGDDVAEVFERAIFMAPGAGEVIEVGSVPITVGAFALEVQSACGSMLGLKTLPARPGEGALFPAVLDQMRDILEFEPPDHGNPGLFRARLELVRDYYKEQLAMEEERVTSKR